MPATETLRWSLAPVVSAADVEDPDLPLADVLAAVPLANPRLDTRPLLELCRAVGVHDQLYFRTRGKKSVSRYRNGERLVGLPHPIAVVVTPEPRDDMPFAEWVTGIITTNPFSTASPSVGAPPIPDGLSLLRTSEYLICDMGQHHPLDELTYTYHLRGFEHARTSDGLVCRPVADWERDDAGGE